MLVGGGFATWDLEKRAYQLAWRKMADITSCLHGRLISFNVDRYVLESLAYQLRRR